MTDVCEIVETLKKGFVMGEVTLGETTDNVESWIFGERGKSF